MQLPLPSIVEQPERGVTVLLDFGENDAGADRVDGSGRNKEDLALMNIEAGAARSSRRPNMSLRSSHWADLTAWPQTS